MGFDHSGRVAFVTGAGSGIGRATALRLADEGAAVAVVDVRSEAADETRELIAGRGGRALGLTGDVSSRKDVHAARDEALAELGRIDYLVNNAGVVRMTWFDDLDEEEWDFVVDTNLKGMFLVTQALAPALAASGSGAVVNLSTVEAEVVAAPSGHPQVHYSASKGGVKMLTKALAVELSDRKIRVNAVAPGPIATGFAGGDPRSDEAWAHLSTRLLVPRVGEPEDVAAAISFLLSDDASFVTGAQLPVDGGWLTQ